MTTFSRIVTLEERRVMDLLSRAGYQCMQAQAPGYVLVSDPMQCSNGRATWTEYAIREVRVQDVHKFIEARS